MQKDPVFCEKRGLASQSIFSSPGMIIQDGTYSTAIYVLSFSITIFVSSLLRQYKLSIHRRDRGLEPLRYLPGRNRDGRHFGIARTNEEVHQVTVLITL